MRDPRQHKASLNQIYQTRAPSVSAVMMDSHVGSQATTNSKIKKYQESRKMKDRTQNTSPTAVLDSQFVSSRQFDADPTSGGELKETDTDPGEPTKVHGHLARKKKPTNIDLEKSIEAISISFNSNANDVATKGFKNRKIFFD